MMTVLVPEATDPRVTRRPERVRAARAGWIIGWSADAMALDVSITAGLWQFHTPDMAL